MKKLLVGFDIGQGWLIIVSRSGGEPAELMVRQQEGQRTMGLDY